MPPVALLSRVDEFRLNFAKCSVDYFHRTKNKLSRSDFHKVFIEKYKFRDVEIMTTLIHAALYNNIEIVKELLITFNGNVNDTGNVRIFDEIVKGVSALWIAAALGHFDLVIILIHHQADVNLLTNEKISPLMAACSLIKKDIALKIVKHLVNNGANVSLPDIRGKTCLMMAVENDNEETVLLLLKNGADINFKMHSGCTALHFAAGIDKTNMITVLLAFNAQHFKNNKSMTPVMVAAENANVHAVVLLENSDLTREDSLDVRELLGASCLAAFDSSQREYGFSLLLNAMKSRHSDSGMIKKKIKPLVEFYNRLECQTVEELLNIKHDEMALFYESVMIRERILGETNDYFLRSLGLFKSKYIPPAFKRSTLYIKSLNYAVNIGLKNKLRTYLYSNELTKFIYFVVADEYARLFYFRNVWKGLIEDLKLILNNNDANSINEKKELKMDFFQSVDFAVNLVNLTFNSTPTNCEKSRKDVLVKDIMTYIVKLVKMNPKINGQTILHILLAGKTVFTQFVTNYKSPNLNAVSLLIFCGADVNAVDDNQNTPLHIIGDLVEKRNLNNKYDGDEIKLIIMKLIESGAHVDYINKKGECPSTGYLKTVFDLKLERPLSLKCLSARAVRNHKPEIAYQDALPLPLKEFTDLHGC